MPKFSTEADFWRRVHKTESCWLWTGPVHPQDLRPLAHFNGEKMHAARAAYLMEVGPIEERQQIRRTCRNHNCVNPSHLRLFGVTDAQVEQMRREYFTGGATQAEVAARHGVSRETLTRLINRKLR